MFKMVDGLVSRGHIVDEYCPETADLSFLPLDNYVRRSTVLPYEPLGVYNKRIPLLTPYISAARLSHDLKAMAVLGQKTAEHLNRISYDAIFSHDCQLVFAPDVLRYVQLPSIHYFHIGARGLFIEDKKRDSTAADLVALKEKYYTPAQKLFRWLRYRQSSNNFRAVDRILTNSNFSKDELRTTYGVTAQVCYLGVDVAKFRPLQIGRENFLLSVGAVHYHKGYRFLIRSLAQLPEKQRSPLIIAANNSDPAELRILRDLASEKGVNFTVRNIKDADEMVELYNRAAAFVYSPIREPWGLAAVEAMACGTPVVAVGEGGITESIVDGETGLLTPRDEKLFADVLNQVFANPGLAARLGSGGVARARSHFTWDKTVDRLETHFHELILEHNAL